MIDSHAHLDDPALFAELSEVLRVRKPPASIA